MPKLPIIHKRLGELICLISDGRSQEAVALLDEDPSLVKAEHPSGTTALYFAIRHQTPRMTDHLIALGANVNPRLPGRESLRQLADRLPDQDILDSLIGAGAKNKSRRRQLNEQKPIYPTIAELTAEDLRLCAAVSRAASFHRIAQGFRLRRLRQLLSFACRERAVSLASRLIAILPTVDYCTDDEGSPLLEAALSGSLELVRMLLEAGSVREIVSAFDFAVERGHLPVVAELLPTIEQKKYRNYFGWAVPGMAQKSANRGYTALAELLLPFASRRSATITRRLIAQWREQYLDQVPQCFSWSSECFDSDQS